MHGRRLTPLSTIVAGLLATGALVALQAPALATVTEGLVASYPFEGDATDASGNGHHAMVLGAQLTADRLDVPRAAYAFDGQDDRLEVATSPDLEITDAISLAAWVRPMIDGAQLIVWKGEGLLTDYLLGLGENGVVGFTIRPDGSPVSVTAAPGYVPGEWMLIVATWDGSTMSIFVNGTQVASRPVGGTLTTGGTPLQIGAHPSIPNLALDGDLDDVMIWDRALSETEVASLMTGPVAAYAFNGDASDSSPNGNDGAVTGAALTRDRFGLENAAYAFDGVDDKIITPGNATFEISGPITLTAWVRPIEQKSQYIVRLGGSPQAPFSLGLAGNGLIVFGLKLDDAPTQLTRSGYTLGQWTFLAATWDCTTMRLYENGVLVASQPASGVLSTDSSPLIIGTRLSLPADTFKGDLDEITVWRGALTDAQVMAIMGDAPTPTQTTTWGGIKAWHTR